MTAPSGPEPLGSPHALVAHALAALLLAALALTADCGARWSGPAFDEPLHLGAGLAHLSTGDFRLDQGTGVLPQMWAALPLWRGGGSLDADASAWSEADVWELGRSLLYAGDRDPAAVLRPARRMVLALGVVLGAGVYLWSLRLHGPGGALISLALYAVCPNLLAHASLVTSDVPTALAFLAAMGAAAAALARPSLLRVALAGVAAGLLFLCKATSLLFAPMLAVLAAWRVAAPPAADRIARARRMLAATGALLALGLACVWAAHGLAFRPAGADAPLDWSRVDTSPGAFPPLLRVAREGRLLPETWLHGVGYAWATTRDRVAFAAGRTSNEGWWWYFPYTVLVKTPLGTLGMFALAAAAGLRGMRRQRAGTAPLWILLGVYGVASLVSSVNIGIRHLLPMLAPALILAGAAVRWCDTRWGRAAVALCLAAAAAESFAAWPHHLSFVNRAFGGPAAGYQRLVDSNLDWGQDLPALVAHQRELRARGDGEPCYLAYFGSALPERHGVACARLPGFFDAAAPLRASELGPGLYYLSATMLQGVYLEPELRGPWGAPQEARLASLDALLASPLGATADRTSRARLEWLRLRMRFAKLSAALRARPPDDRVADSILVYRVGADELAAALAPQGS
ncbi:MAG TPA: glycosyltransferase family 39 protein [Myxococcota bacterium]|nr:glycosyltransferase family 39 protein [Myxococcota bacterium]